MSSHLRPKRKKNKKLATQTYHSHQIRIIKFFIINNEKVHEN